MDPGPEAEALDLIVSGYDAFYSAAPRSPTLERLWRAHACGDDFPWEFGHISFLPLAELEELCALLGLRPGTRLVDLACGTGGPGLFAARATGATLVGVDASPVAITRAVRRAERLDLARSSRFELGTFAATGLDNATVDAAMSIDALQYAPDKRAALQEAARIVRPGGRLAFTAFELDPPVVVGLHVWGIDPVDDYRSLLGEAGFDVTEYRETPGWATRVDATYTAVLAALDDLTAEMGEAAASVLALEATLTLEHRPYRRRVLAAATRAG